MEMVARKFVGPDAFEKMKDEEYLYWDSLPPGERLAAGHQLSVESYRAYGYPADGQQLKTVAVRFEREFS
jgi:hypothetical protein